MKTTPMDGGKNMKEPKLGRWNASNVKPHTNGVYERNIQFISGKYVYSRWNGRYWSIGKLTPEDAHTARRMSGFNNCMIEWRGLANKP